MKTKEILNLALMTSVYINAYNNLNEMQCYNPSPRGSRHKSTLNKKQSSKRSIKNKLAKQSRKKNRK